MSFKRLTAKETKGLLGAGNSTAPSLDPDGGITSNKIDGIFPPANSFAYNSNIHGYSPIYTSANRIKWTTPLTQVNITISSNGRYEPRLYYSLGGNNYAEAVTDPNNPLYPSLNQTYYIEVGNGNYRAVKLEKDENDVIAISKTGANIAGNIDGYVTDFTFANATLNGKALKLPNDLNNQSISILCKGCYQFVSIKLETNRPAGTGVLFTPEPNTTSKYRNSQVYVVGIGKTATTEAEILANIFKGIQDARSMYSPSDTDVPLVTDHHSVNLHYDKLTGKYSFVKASSPAPVFFNGGIGELSGGGEEEYGGEDTVPSGDDTTPGGGDTVPSGDDTTPGGGDTVPSGEDTTTGGGDTVPTGEDTTPGGKDTVPSVNDTPRVCFCPPPEQVSRFEGNPLVIHTGPKANQRLYVYIKCMKSEAMGLKGIGVETRERALETLDKLDFALEYALNEATQMGAYQMRLGQTVETLTARHENTIAAESVITDADMAKEMTNYIKHNLLAQSSQAMLAQANQNAGGVLSLLQ